MAGDSRGYAVEHHEAAFGYGRLHACRFAHYGTADLYAFLFQMGEKGSHAVLAAYFLLGRDGQEQVEGQRGSAQPEKCVGQCGH
ncbi:hypothetical protein IMSAGC021_00056 [Muribaculaceae bacterium]|nr:hypothetical protein IMSAGC021_00056 [Muribaculaceae bacterium]